MKNIISIFNVSVFTVSICFSTYSHAWNFHEHRKIGHDAFLDMCEELKDDYKGNVHKLNLLRDLICNNVKEKARTYGIRSALSGDHINSPEDFETVSAEVQALSWINYGELATKNHEHFWPHVKQVWRKYHELAVDSSLIAQKHWNDGRKTKSIKELDKALILSAYSNHFLHDSFSIGHNGFSRINSTQNSSLIFHDEWNRAGRLMKGSRHSLERQETYSTKNNLHENILFDKRPDECLSYNNSENNADLKEENIDCSIDIWFALGDGYLNKNTGNEIRTRNANISALKAVVITFLEGNDNGYSLAADNLFPISTENFIQHSVYTSKYKGLYSVVNPEDDECQTENGEGYLENNYCWIDIDSSFMEPVYPNWTIQIGRTDFNSYGKPFYSTYMAYSLHTYDKSSIFYSWPNNTRIYYLINFDDAELSYQSNNASTYREIGFTFTLPNFYDGTIFSHDLNFAHAFLARGKDNAKWSDELDVVERGGYIGLNTSMDIVKYKLTLGLGWFLPNHDLSDTEFKVNLMFGIEFGTLGGGALSRWKD